MFIAHFIIASGDRGKPTDRFFLGNDLGLIKTHVAEQFGDRATFVGMVIPESNPQLKSDLREVEELITRFRARPNATVIELPMPEIPTALRKLIH